VLIIVIGEGPAVSLVEHQKRHREMRL